MNRIQNLKVERLHNLINVTPKVNENYDNFEVVLQHVLHAIEIITDCEATSFLVYDPQTKDLTFKLASGKNTHELIGLVVPEGKGLAHAAAREKKGMIVNNILEKAKEHYSDIDALINFKTINLMAFPMLDANGELMGVIEACNKKNNRGFTNEDFQILLIFCQQAERTIRHSLKVLSLNKRFKLVLQRLDEHRFPDFVYSSKEMDIKFNFAKKIAATNSQVLIYGEKGTGKTHMAIQIHKYSNRHENAIEYINCCNMEHQNEREDYIRIFGAKKNYKLGIKQDIPGTIEKAHEGTVVFQEIGFLSLAMQGKLLEFIKTNTYTPTGTTEKIKADVRILATTSQKIDKLVEMNKFSEELYYRLNSLNIFISPLRLRPEDITSLAQYYLKKNINESKKIIKNIHPRVFYILKQYNWPYNVSELINVVQRAVLLCDDATLGIQHLSIYSFSFKNEFQGSEDGSMKQKIVHLQDAVNKFKKQYIYTALLHNNCNHTQTAQVLGIQRSYLSKLIKTYDLKTRSIKQSTKDRF